MTLDDTPDHSALLAGMEIDRLLALQAALEKRLSEEREKLKAQAQALGGSVKFERSTGKKTRPGKSKSEVD